jgi:glycerate kinase
VKKIVIAADSFKGSLSSEQVADSVEKGILKVFPQCEIQKVFIADGGEGTVDALVETLKGESVTVTVNNPLMQVVEAHYGIIENGTTAVIEIALASGLPLIAPEKRNPMKTTTFGTGELIKDALSRGCRRFLVGIGGSATNDAGTGMLQALGYRFFSADGNELGKGGEILSRIERIDDSCVIKEIRDSEFIIACDVTNPFSGKTGAAYIFAPQKGADSEMVKLLDDGLKHFASVIKNFNGINIDNIPGAGAAGGLGGGFKAFLNASLVSGINRMLDAIDFDKRIQDADLIITGEGKLDTQTAMGKAPRGVLDRAKKYHIPVIAIGGAVEAFEELNNQGFAAVFPILPIPTTLEKAMEPDFTKANIENTIIQIMRMKWITKM